MMKILPKIISSKEIGMNKKVALLAMLIMGLLIVTGQAFANDTTQLHCYDEAGLSIPCPAQGEALFGQDANYVKTGPTFQNNGDGTISDLATGLTWQQTPSAKITFAEAFTIADSLILGGYDDWRVPTITELYSLMDFDGMTNFTAETSIPYINTVYFDFSYGDESAGERLIDAQYWSSTRYVSTTTNGVDTVFGVNFADGRIKGYPVAMRGEENKMFVRYVRGDAYGVNEFVDNGNGTITDNASGLTWQQADSGTGMNWASALAYCENLSFAGADDWRLPDAHELQGIVDYSRSPDTTNSAAINPIFSATSITDEGGNVNYPSYWTSTTHLEMNRANFAVYVAFGEALGYMTAPNSTSAQLMDVHGAGAQRSDPKTGNASDYPTGHGPQGDVVRINNFVRCVRGGNYTIYTGGETNSNITGVMNQPPQQGQGQEQQGQNQPPQQQGQGQGQPPQGQTPPQEAINACNGMAVGNSCTVNPPNQSPVTGTCQQVQNVTACVPTRP
jgi:hypothetical protein